MRRVASVGWLLLVGCNRIFGIAATQPWDAMPDIVPDKPHVVLTRQLATTTPSGAPSAQLEYPPFAPGMAPQIRIAMLDGDFGPATYSTDDPEPGWIEVPRDYFARPDDAHPARTWRLEYTLPGGVPHEVQWAPEERLGRLVVPMAGRVDRPAVPGGSGYTVTLNNFQFPATAVHHPRVLTTGLWTSGPTAPPVNNADGMTSVIDYDFANAVPLSGPRGAPVAAQGDRGLLVDYVNNPDNSTDVKCNVAVGATALDQLALTTTGHTLQTVAWDTLRQKVVSELPDLTVFARLSAGLGALNTPISIQDSVFLFGSVPSTSFPGLIVPPGDVRMPGDFRLPSPVILPLLQCPQGPGAPGPSPTDPDSIPKTAQPPLLGDFPTAVHIQLAAPRPVLGVTLFSGMETVIAASAGGGFKLSFPAAIPTKIALTTPAAARVDLVGGPDQMAVGAPTGTFTLDFVPEVGPGLRADYHDVYLHRIAGGQLTPVRVYTVTAPQVKIDGSRFGAGGDFVFEIRSYAGHVMAPRGDFAPVSYPYGSAVVFTRTFKVP